MNRKGFALFYVLVIVSVVFIAVSMFSETALEEIFISSDRYESHVAEYMAESGLECVLYHQKEYAAFGMVSDPEEYRCNDHTTFEAGWGDLDLGYEPPGENRRCYWDDEDNIPVMGLGLKESDYYGTSYVLLVADLPGPIIFRTDNSNACAQINIEVKSRNPAGECSINVRSVGISECDSEGNPTSGAVERTRRFDRVD